MKERLCKASAETEFVQAMPSTADIAPEKGLITKRRGLPLRFVIKPLQGYMHILTQRLLC